MHDAYCVQILIFKRSLITFDLSFTGLLVETLDVAGLAHIQRSIHENFKERKTSIIMNFPGTITILNLMW